MALNDILRFAESDIGTNLLTQAEYLADAQRTIGHQPGIARSKLENKALRQASAMVAGLAQFLADNQATDINDSLTPAQVSTALLAAVGGSRLPSSNGWWKPIGGMLIQWCYIEYIPSISIGGIISFSRTWPISFSGVPFAIVTGKNALNTSESMESIENIYFASSSGFSGQAERIYGAGGQTVPIKLTVVAIGNAIV